MSTWSPDDQEEVIVLTTKKPTPRWLRILLKALAVLLALALVVAGFFAWRYFSVQQRLKRDLTAVIQEEEHIRSLGGINAISDLLDPKAPYSWRFRYLSSIRERKGRPEPEVLVKSVDYDGVNARVHLTLDGVRQFRHYRLYAGKDWRRAPFVAKGWGYKQTLEDVGGFELVYWDEDKDFAQRLATDLPDLERLLQGLTLTPSSQRIIIIPQELGELVRQGKQADGVILNSPYVDLIAVPPEGVSTEELLRAELAKTILAEARKQTPVISQLPGAVRVQNAIDDVLAWQWAAGDVPDEVIAEWARALKGYWASPVTGLSPELITKLPPDAPDTAARLMMALLLRKEGVDALLALSAALPQAASWDDAYQQAVGKTASQVEQAARAWAAHLDGAPSQGNE